MSMEFHLYHDGIEVEPAPIYVRDLKAYRRDSKRFRKNKGQTRRNLIRGYVASILNRMTLPNSSVSVLLVAGTLFASHCVYA
jgi:hypothetical protein